MLKKLLLICSLFLAIVVFLALWFSHKSYTFSDELLSTLEGCKESQRLYSSSDSFSETEFKEMQELTDKCIESKLQYIKSKPNSSGLKIKYGFW